MMSSNTLNTAETAAVDIFRPLLTLTSEGDELIRNRTQQEQEYGPHCWRVRAFDHIYFRCMQAASLTEALQFILQPGDDTIAPFIAHDGDIQCSLANISDAILMVAKECVQIVEEDVDESTDDFHIALCRARSIASMASTILTSAGSNSTTTVDLASWSSVMGGGLLDLLKNLFADCANAADAAARLFASAHDEWQALRETALDEVAAKPSKRTTPKRQTAPVTHQDEVPA